MAKKKRVLNYVPTLRVLL